MERAFDGTKKSNLDQEIEQQLLAHCQKHRIDALDAVKLFAVLGRRQWLKRFLAHAELFKQTLDVPGDLAELGVWRGAGLMTWANLLETYVVGNRTKTVYGFDNWEGFTGLAPEDGAQDAAAGKVVGGFSPKSYLPELKDAIAIFDQDRFIPQKARVKLVPGDIAQTVPQFVKDNPGVRFSLIHFDCDLYQPTKAALEAFWPVLSVGGLMLFDEYAIPNWPGETRAVDEFIAGKPGLRIRTLNWNNTPAGYLVKE